MGENYVDLMWRVVKNGKLIAAFIDFDAAKEYADVIGGEVWIVSSQPAAK